jgi:glycerophosphoryl diester phosphodiesterase
MREILMVSLALMIGACGAAKTAGPDQRTNPVISQGPAKSESPASIRIEGPEAAKKRAKLPQYFDCLREANGMLIAAHRGGPSPGYPENALETLKKSHAEGLLIFEIDIHETRDGQLFLMHDDRLGRTTTGDGYVSDTTWSDISGLKLKDETGAVTAYSPAKFTDALLWAKASGAILELDRKDTTSFGNLAKAVKAAGAEDHVIYITYNDEQAGDVAKVAPGAMLTASAFGDRNVDALRARGIDPDLLIAWTGTREPIPDSWSRLREVGVEPAFGTLGRSGERLDDIFFLDGDASEYDQLADQGLVLLATDEPQRAAAATDADERAIEVCGR